MRDEQTTALTPVEPTEAERRTARATWLMNERAVADTLAAARAEGYAAGLAELEWASDLAHAAGYEEGRAAAGHEVAEIIGSRVES